MTVSTTHAYKLHNGNGTTGPYPIDFAFFAASELVVTRISALGVETVLTLTTDYTISGGVGSTGSVTTVVAVATGARLRIDRATAATQEASWSALQRFSETSLTRVVDRFALRLQEHDLRLGRALSIRMTDYIAGVSGALPAPEAGKLLRWNENETALENGGALALDVDTVEDTPSISWDFSTPGIAKAYVDHGPILMLVLGQSNSVIQEAYSWTPNPRVKLWNVALQVEASIGTAFIDQPNTWINTAARFASEIAEQEDRDVLIVPMGWGGIPIEKFVHGLQYKWDANTAVSDPGTGEIKGNHASLASITKFSASTFESDGVNSGFVTFAQLVPGHYWELRKGGVLIAKYTVSAVVDHTTWFEITVANVSVSGTLSGGDDLRALGPPNMQLLIDNNLPPALAAAGKTHADLVFLWQGEANAGAPANWVNRTEELISTLTTAGYMAQDTPIIVSGISGTAQTGSPAFGQFSNHVQVFVGNDPARRCYFEPAVFPQAFWDASAFWFHLTGTGIDLAGRLLYDVWAKGVGRKISGLIYDRENGNIGLNGIPEADLSYRKNINAPVIDHVANSHVGSSAAVLRRAISDAGNLDMIAQSLAAGGIAAVDWNGAARLLIRSQLSPIDFSASASAATDFQIGNSGAQVPQGKKLNFADLSSNHALSVQFLEELTANRLLTLAVGDAARTLTLSGNPTLADWFDQSVKASASPIFANSPLIPIQATVNFNAGNTDTAFAITLPAGFTRYQINAVIISQASASLTTAMFGVFTATAAGGFAAVASGTACTVSTASELANNNMQVCSIVNTLTQNLNAGTLYFRVQTPQGSAATAKVTIVIRPVS